MLVLQKDNLKSNLTNELKRYEAVLGRYVIDYLKSLLELETSVVREEITTDVRSILTTMKLYTKIAQYNIYFRALNLLEKQNIDCKTNFGYLIGSKDGENLFQFYYNENTDDNTIGAINLYQTLIMDDLTKKGKIAMLRKKIEDLNNSKNPYSDKIEGQEYVKIYWFYQARDWEFERQKEIAKYEEIQKK